MPLRRYIKVCHMRKSLLLLFVSFSFFASCGRQGGPVQINPGNKVVDRGLPDPVTPGPATVSNGVLALSNGQGASFSNVTINLAQPVSRNITLTNTSSVAADGVRIALTGAGFGVVSSDCPANLSAQASCTIVVGFLPRQATTFQGELSVSQSRGNPVALPLQGNGVPEPLGHLTMEALPDPGLFGNMLSGGSVSHVFYLLNDGNGSLTSLVVAPPMDQAMVASPFFVLQQSSALPNDPNTPVCGNGATLAPGQRCGFVASFRPQVPPGTANVVPFAAAIPIRFNDNQPRNVSWPVTGNSALAPTLVVENAAPASFVGLASGSFARTCISVRNPHTALGVGNIAVPALAAPFSIDPSLVCGQPACASMNAIPPSGVCDIPVRYAPSAGGNASVPVVVNYSDGVGPKEARGSVAGSAMNECTFTVNKEVFSAGSGFAVMVESSGSTTFTLPADAKNITARLTRIAVDDYAPVVKINGTGIYNNAGETFQSAHSINVNSGVVLNPGANVIWASAKSYIYQPTSVSVRLTGSYSTAGACNAN